MGTAEMGRASVNADKGNKNSFYLKQQLQNNRSKDRASGSKKASMMAGSSEEGYQLQHRKNNSVVINRGDVLRVDGKPQRKIDGSPDRIGQSNKALKLPGMQDQHYS